MSKKYRKIFANLMSGSILLGSVATMAMSCSSSSNKEKEKTKPVTPEQPTNPTESETTNETSSDSVVNDAKNQLKLILDKVTEYLKTLSDTKYAELKQELEQEYQRANTLYSSKDSKNDVYASAKLNLDKAYEKAVENKKVIDNKPTDVPPVQEIENKEQEESSQSDKEVDKTNAKPDGETDAKEPKDTTTPGSDHQDAPIKDDKSGEVAPSNEPKDTTTPGGKKEKETPGSDHQDAPINDDKSGEVAPSNEPKDTTTPGDKKDDQTGTSDETTPKKDDSNIKPKEDEVPSENIIKELSFEHVEVKKLLSNSNVNEYLKTTYPGYTFKKYDGTNLEENKVISHNETIKLVGTKVEDNNKKYALVSIQSSSFAPVDLNKGENSNVLSGNTNIELNVEKSYYDYTDNIHPNQKRSTELPKMFDGNKVESSRWDNWIDYGLDQSHNVFYFNRKKGSNESKIFGLRVWTRVSGYNPIRSWHDFDKYNNNQRVELQNGKSMSPEWIKIYSSSTGEEGSYKLVTGQNKVNDSELFKIKVLDGFRLIDETVNVGNLKETNNIYGIIINFQPTTDKYFKFEFEAPTIPNLKDPEGQENRIFTTNKGFIGFSEIEFIELKNDVESINDKVQASENASISFTALEHFGDSFKLNIDNKDVELNSNEQTLSIQVPQDKTFEEVFKTLFDNSTIKNSDNSNLQEGIYTFGYVSEVTTNTKTQKETSAKAKIVVTDGTTEHKKEFTINLTKAEVATPVEETNQ
ncbi:hypothetical protein [Mycoplasma sp. CSL7503-lung]|uniref:hypothetical protein n=1 Tax=Mycoplasma sp. CSL7503-lung TaxID=536372 RepID=UPI0021D2266A|nr:hypothetical protein [Mycoplasma sp. CSL7503-lung]MCU4706449.1 hypothetical protein [Mycoplasma sp. CSL7503-lung]